MDRFLLVGIGSLIISVSMGCHSTKIVERESDIGDEKLARPDRILVYDFASTMDGIPDDSAFAEQIDAPQIDPSDKELEVGRRLGSEVSTQLASEISAMGLRGVRAVDSAPPRPGDLVIKGYFVSIDEGSTAKRMLVGFGSGDADLKTVVEGYQMTDMGLRRLGSGEVDSGGHGGSPGLIVPIAVTIATANPIGLAVGGAVKVATEVSGTDKIDASAKRTAELIATELRPKFQEQGWISY